MKVITILLLDLLLITGLMAEAQPDLFSHYTIKHKKMGEVQIHVATEDSSKKKPLLIYLDGSGNFPLFYKTKSGRYATTVPLNIKKHYDKYHIVLISKPNVPFTDSISITQSGDRYYPKSEVFNNLYTLDWRVKVASKAIDFSLRKVNVDRSKIIVMGYSEGAQVAPTVALMNKKVTHVVCFLGNALNHLFDFLLEARLKVTRQEVNSEEGQRIVDSLFVAYENIYADRTSTSKKWYGETHLKWSSFSKETPLEAMLKLQIPILYVAAAMDKNQPIFSMDYAKLEFMRRGKANLTYKVYPNCDHFLQEQRTENGKTLLIDRADEAHSFALDWIDSSYKTFKQRTNGTNRGNNTNLLQ